MTCRFCKIPCNNSWCVTEENSMSCFICEDAIKNGLGLSNKHMCSDYKSVAKTSGFLEQTPDEVIEKIMKEFDKPENYYDLEPANTEKFVYLPITIMNDILTELKEIKALLEKK